MTDFQGVVPVVLMALLIYFIASFVLDLVGKFFDRKRSADPGPAIKRKSKDDENDPTFPNIPVAF